MPLHDGLQHRREEPAVPARLILSAAGDRVGYVTEYPVVADQGGEVWSFQHVDHTYKLGSVDSIARRRYSKGGKIVNDIPGGEDAPWEKAKLKELGDGLVLGRPVIAKSLT